MTTATISAHKLTLLRKAAEDNGFEREITGEDGWLGFSGTQAPLEIWLTLQPDRQPVAAMSRADVLQGLGQFGTGFAGARPAKSAGAIVVADFATLHNALRRAWQLARTLPDALLNEFLAETASMPKKTEAERLMVMRVGQDVFRKGLREYWNDRCAISGLAVPRLLRASHIKPWKDCELDSERLDVFNGLLLAPHLDAVFDAALMTVRGDGSVELSPALNKEARSALGLSATMKIDRLTDRHRAYLKWHHTMFDRIAATE